MIATPPSEPSSLAGPPAQGRSASRIASDRQGAIEVLSEIDDSGRLARRRPDHAVGAPCIGRPRPHDADLHRARRRFPGRTRDGRYCRARYYHPSLQRFISEDPIGFASGDSNFYAYVMNRPPNDIDPLGLEPITISAAVAAGIVCATGAIAGDVVVLAVNGRKSTWGQLAAGAGIGCVGGIGVLAAYAAAVPAAFSTTEAAVASAPWIIIPPALAKLEQLATKFGTTTDAIVRAAQQSNARFTDLLAKNWGNVNIFLSRPDGAAGFVRVTTDPSGTRVISAGLMRSGQVANGIVNGRFLPLR
jgi:RHS repeat-associated protein